MEDKYYTPKAEEFHVGFEFEETPFIGDYKLTSNPVWHKVIYQITEKAPLSTIESMIHFKHARVKYLDSSDIESLGFKFIKIGWTESSMIFRSNRACGYEIYFRDDYTLHISKSSGITLFEGKIKNKSELKKLLIQLEIINE